METKLSDLVKEASCEEIVEHLAELSRFTEEQARSIGEIKSRSNESIAYTNILARTSKELDRLTNFYPELIEGVAWCARNIFEMNLVIRHISRSDENMKRWFGQLAGDEKQVLEGFLSLSGQSHSSEEATLQARLREIEVITKKHNIDAAKPFNIRGIAEKEGLTEVYISLYKLFSKYVHPSSWLINSTRETVQSAEYLNLFVIYSQVYAGDTSARISAWLGDTAEPTA